jgi:hypothetical protein
MVSLLLLSTSVLAADVLVPSFTPEATSDFGVADQLTEEVLQALQRLDVTYYTPGQIQQRAGGVAEGCADEPSCTSVLWKSFTPARIAVVGTAHLTEGMISTKVLFYAPGDLSPINVVSTTVASTEVTGFADQVAFLAQEMLSVMPAVVAPVATKAKPPPPKRPAVTDAAPRPNRYDEEDAPPPPPRPAPRDAADAERSGTKSAADANRHGLPDSAWRKYKASGLSYEKWKKKALVRKGDFLLDLEGGLVFGDVDRRYDTRLRVEQVKLDGVETLETVGAYSLDSFITGQGSTFGLGAAYMPLWWLETGIFGGLQVGKKQLGTGWEHYKDGALVGEETEEWDTVTGWMGTVEPRLRFHFLATGVVKPFAMTGATLRIYDAYTIPEATTDTIVYEGRPGGKSVGINAGAGVAFDIPGGSMAFIEVPWTKVLSPLPYESADLVELQSRPLPANRSGQMMTFRAGFGLRL